MKKINLSILLIVIAYNLSLIQAFDDNGAYCFKFRWLPKVLNVASESNICTGQHDIIPCVQPSFIQDDYPDTSQIWLNRDINENAFCRLTVGSLCLKYSLKINDKIEKASFYCGKIIVDGVASMTPGCYQHNQNGSIVEVCACESSFGREPCNTSNTISSNFVSLIIFLFMLMYINC